MNKVLPLAIFVASVVSPSMVLADDMSGTDRDTANQQSSNVVVDDGLGIDNGFSFTGYARYGAAYQSTEDAKLVATPGKVNGVSTGRLGNEDNGGEFQLNRFFTTQDGAKWQIGVMLNHWGEDVDIAKAFASVTNVFESQPQLRIWAGRDFNQRGYTGLNDYYWMSHDGQGGGFENLNLFNTDVMFDANFMSAIAAGPTDAHGTEREGSYAITSKLHGIQFSDDVSFALWANLGFDDGKESDGDVTDANGNVIGDSADSAFQVAADLFFSSNDRLIVRYSYNTIDSVYDKVGDQDALLVSFDGVKPITDELDVEYLAAYQMVTAGNGAIEDVNQDRSNYSIIVRPKYHWNDVHSTWVEMGYDVVDYDDIDATNSSWKVTVSQNISFGREAGGSRPMLRFYATGGGITDETSGYGDSIDYDVLTFGAMWEASW